MSKGVGMKTRLKEIRKARGFKSAKAFAESIGMQEKTYRNYEQGARNLYLDVACQLCTALGCSLDELVGNKSFARERVEDKEGFSNDERDLIALYRNSDDKGKSHVMETARMCASLAEKNEAGDSADVGRVTEHVTR